jgi:hypothetical protein
MAKKSRRARRQEAQKQSQPTTAPSPPVAAERPAPAAKELEPAPASNRKTINFSEEYFHIYFDMRNVLLISVLMFVVLIALSFAI